MNGAMNERHERKQNLSGKPHSNFKVRFSKLNRLLVL